MAPAIVDQSSGATAPAIFDRGSGATVPGIFDQGSRGPGALVKLANQKTQQKTRT